MEHVYHTRRRSLLVGVLETTTFLVGRGHGCIEPFPMLVDSTAVQMGQGVAAVRHDWHDGPTGWGSTW